MQYVFRLLAMVSAFCAVLLTLFWAVDKSQGLHFHQGWTLVSSIVWAAVFAALSRRKVRQ
jgi:hypothetical protein